MCRERVREAGSLSLAKAERLFRGDGLELVHPPHPGGSLQVSASQSY